MPFCRHCGAAIEPGSGKVCPRCGRVYYEQLKVGAGVLIEREGKLLLLRRTHDPFRDCWNLPAGYVEATESPAQAAVREAGEETGLRVEIDGLVDLYFFDDDPRGNGILIVYRAHVVGGSLAASPEGDRPTWFGRGELPSELSGGGHDRAVHAWAAAGG